MDEAENNPQKTINKKPNHNEPLMDRVDRAVEQAKQRRINKQKSSQKVEDLESEIDDGL